MAATAEARYPQEVLDAFEQLKSECAICYQCGTCTSSCPSGRELYRGPRRIVRLILADEIEAVLKSDDLWRCTECGTCTDVCRMGIDVAAVLHRLRQLERRHGGIRCAERTAADVATGSLKKRPRIDAMRFGAAMVSRGYVPKDKVGAAEMGVKLARQLLSGGMKRPAGASSPAADPQHASVTLAFYAGCSIPQDRELHALVHEVAAGFGVRLDEARDAGCCGHPSRGTVPSLFRTDERVYTACPACDASLAESGVEAVSLWDALTRRAAREPSIAVAAAGERFVPYVGCLADRDSALASLGDAAEQSGAEMIVDYPTLHNGCCGALGGMYRGATKSSARLLEFAARHDAPVVTTCVLCRDNLRSAARELPLPATVRFWPEFFRAVPTTMSAAGTAADAAVLEEHTDDRP
ncbi:MAG: 4Fe-4S dicluster domain-containing protein [Actinobacteria bacterium]|nr:4Fe-4S dicluster domain-containing protein [Actinomycetota bacterium]